MRTVLVGYGEIGKAVTEVFGVKDIHDPDKGRSCEGQHDILLIAIPYNDNFVDTVNAYREQYKVKATIIFSTVAIGTTRQIPDAVHSPVEGKHPKLAESIRLMPRWVGGYGKLVNQFFTEAGFNPVYVTPETTEFLKLQSTAMYGLNIEYARYLKNVCDQLEINYRHVKDFNLDYNSLYKKLGMPKYQRYILDPPELEGIKGHCILENAITLYEQYPSELLRGILALGKHPSTISEEKPYFNRAWLYCEHYGKGKSATQIGNEQGCTGENIQAIMKRRGIRVRRNLWTEEQEEKLLELAKTHTFKEVAKKLNKSHSAVRSRAIQLGIQSCYDPSEQDEETRKKISISLQGVTPQEWDGFKRTANEIIRKSEKYMEWRKVVYERDNYTCQKCGAKGKLNAHHIKSFAKNPELRFDVTNGTTLCVDCHHGFHWPDEEKEGKHD